MALRTARFRPGGRPDRRRLWQTGGFTGLLVLIALGSALGTALGGCSPVETWRSLSGANKNDPDPESAPFTRNLADAEAAPYPNLASFPPPPTRATSTAERQKLTQSLIADRTATAAQAGPPPPPLAATLASAPAPSPSNVQSPGPAAAALAAAPTASPDSKTALNAAPSGRRKAGEPPEPVAQDSTLQMPELRSVPEPETVRPPPPRPALPAVPRPVGVAEPPPAAVASATPIPAPPAPVLAPLAPPPATAKAAPKRAPATTTVATLGIPDAAAEPNSQDRAQIERVAALYKDQPGAVRVLTYAAAPAAGEDPLDSYRTALERARAVANALVEAGIPADKIQTEAVPAAGAKAGRVEIQFAQ